MLTYFNMPWSLEPYINRGAEFCVKQTLLVSKVKANLIPFFKLAVGEVVKLEGLTWSSFSKQHLNNFNNIAVSAR